MFLTVLKNINLAVIFLLELVVLVALGYWGFHIGSDTLAKIALGIGAPVLAIVAWAVFGAPRSRRHLHDPWYLLLQVIFFGSAAVALYASGLAVLSMVFALIFVIACSLSFAWGQR